MLRFGIYIKIYLLTCYVFDNISSWCMLYDRAINNSVVLALFIQFPPAAS